MMDASKYNVGYYPPPVEPGHVYEWPQKDHIEQAPAWCSVDPVSYTHLTLPTIA